MLSRILSGTIGHIIPWTTWSSGKKVWPLSGIDIIPDIILKREIQRVWSKDIGSSIQGLSGREKSTENPNIILTYF